MRRALCLLGVALQTCSPLNSEPRRRPPTRLLGSTDTDVDDLRQRLEAGAFFLDSGHDVLACDARQAAQHAGDSLQAAVLTGERRCVIDCRVDTFESTSRRFSADDTARWVRRCANEVAFFFETCTLLYPQAASGAAPTAAGLPVEPLLKRWGQVQDSADACGLAPTDCSFVVSPSTFEELVALRRLYHAAMEARALVVVVNHGFDAPPPELEEATEVYRLQPLDVEEPTTGRIARVCVSRRFPADYEVYAARSENAYEPGNRGVFTQRPDDAVVRAVARQVFDEVD